MKAKAFLMNDFGQIEDILKDCSFSDQSDFFNANTQTHLSTFIPSALINDLETCSAQERTSLE